MGCSSNKHSRMNPRYSICRFYDACIIGDVEKVKSLIRMVDVNRPNEAGFTPLHIACENGNVEVAKLIINDDRINCLNSLNNNEDVTPLMIAAKKDQLELLELMIEKGANTEIKDAWGKNAFMHAITYNSSKVAFKLVFTDGVDVSLRWPFGGNCVTFCISNNDSKLMRALLDHTDVSINHRELFIVFKTGNENMLKVILASRREIDIFDKEKASQRKPPLAIPVGWKELVLPPITEEYKKNPDLVRKKLRLELGWAHDDAAKLYVIIKLIEHGCLENKEKDLVKFFKISSVLPDDLKQRVCNMRFGVTKEFISLEKHREHVEMFVKYVLKIK